jgi:hypothetical protein
MSTITTAITRLLDALGLGAGGRTGDGRTAAQYVFVRDRRRVPPGRRT